MVLLTDKHQRFIMYLTVKLITTVIFINGLSKNLKIFFRDNAEISKKKKMHILHYVSCHQNELEHCLMIERFELEILLSVKMERLKYMSVTKQH